MRTLLGAMLVCLCGCGDSGDDKAAASAGAGAAAAGPGGSGGSGGGASSSGSGGVNDACVSNATDGATAVTIRIRNDRDASVFLSPESGCDERFRIEAPSGLDAPWSFGNNACTTTDPNCPQDCFDEFGFEALAPGAEFIATWDGHLVEDVDAVAMQCPFAQAIEPGCLGNCQRTTDAPADVYQVTAIAWSTEDGFGSKITGTAELDYPATTEILVTLDP